MFSSHCISNIIFFNKKFVNRKNIVCFQHLIYELVKGLEKHSDLNSPPRYAIIKIYKNSWGHKLRFYDFCNCVFSYWSCALRALTHPGSNPGATENKTTTKRWSCYFGRAICAIHELILFVKFCYLGKILKCF